MHDRADELEQFSDCHNRHVHLKLAGDQYYHCAQQRLQSGTDGCFKGIAIYQDRRAANGNTNKVNGGSSNVIQGAVYFPKGVLQINGTGDAVSLCAMWVAKDIDLIGTSNIAISAPDDAACSGSGMPSPAAVHMVRLVA